MNSSYASSPQFPYNKHRGPHPGVLAIVHILLFAASLILLGILSHGADYPRPFGPLEAAQKTFLRFSDAFRINAFFQFASAIPLGLFTAAVCSRLRFLGVNVTGVSIAFFGGTAASIFFLLSGLCGWILSQPAIAGDLVVMHAIQLLGFGGGGIAFTAALGLLMAGVSVPCLFGKYTPRWVAWLGLVLAGIAELSVITLIVPQFVWLLPIVRFPSFIWMIGTGFTLIKKRPEPVNS